MKDSGNMKVYYLTRDVYEGAIAFTHGFSMKQAILYTPNAGGIIAQNPQNKDEFFYLADNDLIKKAERIIKKKRRGYFKELEVDVDKFYDILDLGSKKKRMGEEFNKKAKSLFGLLDSVDSIKSMDSGIKGKFKMPKYSLKDQQKIAHNLAGISISKAIELDKKIKSRKGGVGGCLL